MIETKLVARAALMLAAAACGLAACNGSSERVGQDVREDARGMRDFFRDRGITINTRLPDR